MTLVERFLLVCAEYQRLTGMTESALSNRLFGGGTRLAAIREGARIETYVYERAMKWLTDNWPKGHRRDWPKGVERVHYCITVDTSNADRRAEMKPGTPTDARLGR